MSPLSNSAEHYQTWQESILLEILELIYWKYITECYEGLGVPKDLCLIEPFTCLHMILSLLLHYTVEQGCFEMKCRHVDEA